MNSSGLSDENENTKRLNQALLYLEQNRNINEDLRAVIDDYIR